MWVISKFETGKHALKDVFVPTADLDPKYKDSLNGFNSRILWIDAKIS